METLERYNNGYGPPKNGNQIIASDQVNISYFYSLRIEVGLQHSSFDLDMKKRIYLAGY